MSHPDWVSTYEQALAGVGCWQFSNRDTFDIEGEDRVQLLQGFCTNDIKKLAEGDGCEAMILNTKGKLLGLVDVLLMHDRIWIEARGTEADALISHLDRYVIREDVTFQNRSAERSLLGLIGAGLSSFAESELGSFELDRGLSSDQTWAKAVEISKTPCRIAWNTQGAPSCLLVDGPTTVIEELQQQIVDLGALRLPEEAVEAIRLEDGVPQFGIDVSENNLPQELNRDESAISFTKGCYLGQETVARIDALGHVNRVLVSIVFSDSFQPQSELILHDSNGDQVGTISSVSYSPRLGQFIGLGFVKRGFHQPSSKLTCQDESASIISIPIRA